ncbi:YbhB/YbcL family Raf kinase inhibitor-like protein [Aurantimonas sp. VKM B-3413]|uniref:YbhB/YbcL family Raf kinase inhibitor-like protein n=1 Tax=Aurantimonas sp. VKM B-3413 TaxID=2779401 RepID=UPI001E52CAE7|nr:YbhB/YbcL family Raf kinase inhibitor-like protein [Aurantimonas sp. VKM B-3413]MCB8839836.1 YbhB/YbcL family Raf kinase inhibitor-like protein [Aurantimonas sp. VKM B-3413]
MAFLLSSPDFKDGDKIPPRHLKTGDNLSPQLEWTDPPGGTLSYVLLMEDVTTADKAHRHWAIFNIPADRRHLAPGRSSGARTEDLPHAVNDFGEPRYDGPHPSDSEHSYRFRLAALDIAELPILEDVPDAATVWDRARDHIIAEAGIMGTAKA